MTVTTFGDLANQVHRMVKGSRREMYSTLNGAITATATTLTLNAPYTGITAGSYLGIESEIIYVISISTATATVRRGMFSTTPAAHADATLVEADWRWFTADVIDALTDDIRSWPEDIFAVDYVDVGVGATSAVDIPGMSGFRHVLAIRRTVSGNSRWVTEPVQTYRVDTGLPTTAFPSTYALYLPNTRAGTGTVRIDYAADFNLDTLTPATKLAAIGLPNTLYDAAKYGAAWRLLVDREAQRSSIESQPEPREAMDVKDGSAVNMGGYYKRLRDQRLADEARRLRSKYPFRFG